ncbi:MAG: DnaJ domain-containing protein, partial [Chloroflexi bacterium]|nr:DnaJ domain-containing protein [Chloroflexota bacterium]
MGVKYKDYYKILGVSRSAPAEEIKKAFRDLAKKYHPDKAKGDKKAEERFKEINEAYEVLGDEKRKKQYDMLGAGFKDGQSFTPPPEWETMFNSGGQGRGGTTYQFNAGADFDLFDLLRGFGMAGGGAGGRGGSPFDHIFEQAGAGGGRSPFGQEHAGPSHLESEMTIPLEDAFRGGIHKVTLAVPLPGPHGHVRNTQKSYDIKIPAGIQDGQKIRLKGEGAGVGDLLIRIKIAPHHVYSFEGTDLVADLKVTPWEAALGSKLSVPTLDGNVETKLPRGARSGRKLRLGGRGDPRKG